ncbi:MAG: HEAT repeat domain-containing protein [Deltaproteobacteria bacterium]|nr:HEAT repeat domain-containing protein [Deltaproteobacteria bacterium]
MVQSFHSNSPTSLVLSGFARLIKKHNMYPSGHPTVDRALDLLLLYFEQYFHQRPAMVINVGHDRLYVDGEERVGEEAVTTLSRALHQHSVSQIIFHQGVGRQELASFLNTLDVDPFEARQTGGYRKLLALKGITSVEITEIDYKISDGDLEVKLDALSDAEVWRRLSKGFAATHEKISAADLDFMRGLIQNAPRLASILDGAIARDADREEASKTADLFIQMMGSLAAGSQAEGAEAAAVFQNDLKRALDHLNPVTRYIVMQHAVRLDKDHANLDRTIFGQSVAEHLAAYRSRQIAQSLFEGLHPDYSSDAEFLKTYQYYVNARNETEILGEIGRIVADFDLRHDTRFAEKMNRAQQLPQDRAGMKRLAETISGTQGDQVSREMPIYEYIENMYVEMPEILRQMAEPVMEERATDNLVDLLELARGNDAYEFYALGMDERILTLIETGRYALADRAIRLLRKHASKKNDHELSQRVARGVLVRIRKPELTGDLVRALNEWGKEESPAISRILTAMGPAAWDAVFDALTREDHRATRAILIDVLGEAGDKCVEKATGYLGHPLWYVVRNMVAVIARLKPEDMVELLDKPSRHQEVRVRKEVARALGVSKDGTAIETLIRLVRDGDSSVRHQAILSMAHFTDSHRGAEFLVKQLSEKPPFFGDEQAELLAIKALGGIRVKVAIPTLGSYVNGGLLSRHSETVVRAAADALTRFDGAEAVQALVRGSKSWNKSIRQICLDCLGRRHDAVEDTP